MKAELISPPPPPADVQLTMTLAEADILRLLIGNLSTNEVKAITGILETNVLVNFLSDMFNALKII